MQNNPLYKKAIFQAARRAILENEMIMRRFVEEYVPGRYDDAKLERLNDLLLKMYDNDMFDLLMGQKRPEAFVGQYDQELLKEMYDFSEGIRQDILDKYCDK